MYVFGYDLPLPEMLTVGFCILLFALILIYYEIRKLSKLLKFEKSEVSQLESDINLLENFLDRNPTDVLINYVSDKLERGTPKKRLREELLKAGFKANTINQVFQKLD
ncbi:hypothetical protein H6503_02425 [Candidatus Woesearchaeota archaeon]|nr:hypothetical protein [Candidatus Woesearchaeota archaeon]